MKAARRAAKKAKRAAKNAERLAAKARRTYRRMIREAETGSAKGKRGNRAAHQGPKRNAPKTLVAPTPVGQEAVVPAGAATASAAPA